MVVWIALDNRFIARYYASSPVICPLICSQSLAFPTYQMVTSIPRLYMTQIIRSCLPRSYSYPLVHSWLASLFAMTGSQVDTKQGSSTPISFQKSHCIPINTMDTSRPVEPYPSIDALVGKFFYISHQQ